jgi:BASS family bile acid:Na+ symporter
MRLKLLFRILLILAVLSLVSFTVLYFTGYTQTANLVVLFFFIFLLSGINGSEILKGFSFTLWVIAAATISMIFPQYITDIGGYKTENAIVPLIQLIMFGMGTTTSINDFVGVLKMPKGVLIGILLQFSIMPVVALVITYIFNFPPEVAAGIILIGCAPSGVSSNILTFLAKGNLPLSITMTSFATLLSPLLTPLLMKLLADQLIPVNVGDMMFSILKMLFLPIIAGVIFNRIFGNRSKWLNSAMPMIAMTANVVIIAVIVAAGRDNLLSIGKLLVVAAIIHNGVGYALGYLGGRMFRMNKRDSRTVAIEVGLHNGGMSAGIASELGKAATMGLYPAIFGTWMDVSGSFLANWWRKNPVKDDPDPEEILVEVKLKTAE